MLHNWTQLYQRQLAEGQEYHEHVPALAVWILDEALFQDGRWLHVFRCRDGDGGLVLHEEVVQLTGLTAEDLRES
jgi:hypothetical protein